MLKPTELVPIFEWRSVTTDRATFLARLFMDYDLYAALGDNHDREVLERAHRVAAAACIYLHGNPSPHEEFVPTPSTTVPSLPQWIPESRELYLVHTFGDTEPDVVLLASPEDLRPFSDQERVVVAALLRLAAEQPRYAPELADAERSLLAAA